MIQKDIIGDYMVTCDECGSCDGLRWYEFRETWRLYESKGWLIFENGRTLCPSCRIKYEEKERKTCLVKEQFMKAFKKAWDKYGFDRESLK